MIFFLRIYSYNQRFYHLFSQLSFLFIFSFFPFNFLFANPPFTKLLNHHETPIPPLSANNRQLAGLNPCTQPCVSTLLTSGPLLFQFHLTTWYMIRCFILNQIVRFHLFMSNCEIHYGSWWIEMPDQKRKRGVLWYGKRVAGLQLLFPMLKPRSSGSPNEVTRWLFNDSII